MNSEDIIVEYVASRNQINITVDDGLYVHYLTRTVPAGMHYLRYAQTVIENWSNEDGKF